MYILDENDAELYRGKITVNNLIDILNEAKNKYGGEIPVYIFDGEEDNILDQVLFSKEGNENPDRIVLI